MLGSTVDTCSSSRPTVEVPLSVHRQSGGYCCYVTETGTHSVKLSKVVDTPVMAQRTFPLVPCSRPQRFPSCSLLIRWSSWLCRSCSSGARREDTVEIPQLQPIFLEPVVHTPVVCNDSCLVDALAQFIDGSHVPVIMQRRLLSGSAPVSVFAVDGGHSSCATEKVTRLSVLLFMVAAKGFFRLILRHFSRSSGCPGVERQFFELSSAHNCECSRAPGGPRVAGSFTPR